MFRRLALKKTPVTSNEISRSLSEDRDRTYELIDGNTILCVSADFSRIWVEDGVKPSYTYGVTDPGYLKNLLEELIPGSHPGNLQGTYVPDGCLYMSNLSSYYAWGGDSGAIYHITPSSFTEERRGGSVVAYDPLPGAWEKIDWESGFFRDFETESINTLDGPRLSVFLTGKEPRYRMINADRFLVWDEGRLLLVDSYEERNGEQTIWSIYLLTGQEGKGEASWTHHPEMGMNEPWFAFEFDLAYSRVEAWASEGEVTFAGEEGGAPEYPEEMTMLWEPGAFGSVQSATIQFTVWEGERVTRQGTVYLTWNPAQNRYEATLIGAGLRLAEKRDGVGIISSRMD